MKQVRVSRATVIEEKVQAVIDGKNPYAVLHEEQPPKARSTKPTKPSREKPQNLPHQSNVPSGSAVEPIQSTPQRQNTYPHINSKPIGAVKNYNKPPQLTEACFGSLTTDPRDLFTPEQRQRIQASITNLVVKNALSEETRSSIPVLIQQWELDRYPKLTSDNGLAYLELLVSAEQLSQMTEQKKTTLMRQLAKILTLNP